MDTQTDNTLLDLTGRKVYLVAAISGTSARFAVMDLDGNELASQAYRVRENPTLIGALRHFCNNFAAGAAYQAAAFGVAGPVLGDVVRFTNSDWICDKDEISKILCTQKIYILNDFEAIALASGNMGEHQMTPLQLGVPSNRHPVLVVGPGTGLGVAALAPASKDGLLRALTTEAGHTRYAPANEHERKIVRFLTRTYNLVSAENLISETGILNLYRVNCLMVSQEIERLSVSDLIDKARAGDQLARTVFDDFAAIFGGFVSQIALSWNALGGVYLMGSLLISLGDLFDGNRFLERFNANPRMADLLSHTPVMRIQAAISASDGLLILLKQKEQA